MRKIAILSIVTASLLLIGCGQGNSEADKAEPAKAQETTKTESVAEKAQKAVESVKDKASEIADKTAETAKKVTETVTQKANEVVETAKETVNKVVNKTENETAKNDKKTEEPTAKPSEPASAPTAYAKCAGCHGKDGKMKALGKSEVIAGQSKDDLANKIKEYKNGSRNVAGMGALMKGQVASLSDADIEAIAVYLSGLK